MGNSSAFCHAAAITLALSAPAQAQRDVDVGNDLYDYCSASNLTDKIVCAAYILGVASGARAADIRHFREDRLICLPVGVQNRQIIDTTVKWLRENPSQRHHLSAPLVMIALSRAFPCRKK